MTELIWSTKKILADGFDQVQSECGGMLRRSLIDEQNFLRECAHQLAMGCCCEITTQELYNRACSWREDVKSYALSKKGV